MDTEKKFDVEIYLTTDDKKLNFGMHNKYLLQCEVTVGRSTLIIEPNFSKDNSKIYFKPFFGSYEGNPKADFMNIMISIDRATNETCNISEIGNRATIYSIIKDYDLPKIAAEMESIMKVDRKTFGNPIYGLYFKEVPEDILLKSSMPDAKIISDIFITDQDRTGYELKGGKLFELPDDAHTFHEIGDDKIARICTNIP